jgi:protein-S-isoprenylcysteine O-methyltransferase Ste14
MLLGLFLILSGEAALYHSVAVLAYLLVVMALSVGFVRFIEEPDLERRFGATYVAYTRQVPRWIPRPVSRSPAGAPPISSAASVKKR